MAETENFRTTFTNEISAKTNTSYAERMAKLDALITAEQAKIVDAETKEASALAGFDFETASTQADAADAARAQIQRYNAMKDKIESVPVMKAADYKSLLAELAPHYYPLLAEKYKALKSQVEATAATLAEIDSIAAEYDGCFEDLQNAADFYNTTENLPGYGYYSSDRGIKRILTDKSNGSLLSRIDNAIARLSIYSAED